MCACRFVCAHALACLTVAEHAAPEQPCGWCWLLTSSTLHTRARAPQTQPSGSLLLVGIVGLLHAAWTATECECIPKPFALARSLTCVRVCVRVRGHTSVPHVSITVNLLLYAHDSEHEPSEGSASQACMACTSLAPAHCQHTNFIVLALTDSHRLGASFPPWHPPLWWLDCTDRRFAHAVTIMRLPWHHLPSTIRGGWLVGSDRHAINQRKLTLFYPSLTPAPLVHPAGWHRPTRHQPATQTHVVLPIRSPSCAHPPPCLPAPLVHPAGWHRPTCDQPAQRRVRVTPVGHSHRGRALLCSRSARRRQGWLSFSAMMSYCLLPTAACCAGHFACSAVGHCSCLFIVAVLAVVKVGGFRCMLATASWPAHAGRCWPQLASVLWPFCLLC
jgi:hypothetical protein